MFELEINDASYTLNDLIKNRHNSNTVIHETQIMKCNKNATPATHTCIKCNRALPFKPFVRTKYTSRRDDDIITYHVYKNCKNCRKAPKNTIILQSPEITDFIVKYVWRLLPNAEFQNMKAAILSELTGKTLLSAVSAQFPNITYSNPSTFRVCVAEAFDQLMTNTTNEQKLAIFDYCRLD